MIEVTKTFSASVTRFAKRDFSDLSDARDSRRGQSDSSPSSCGSWASDVSRRYRVGSRPIVSILRRTLRQEPAPRRRSARRSRSARALAAETASARHHRRHQRVDGTLHPACCCTSFTASPKGLRPARRSVRVRDASHPAEPSSCVTATSSARSGRRVACRHRLVGRHSYRRVAWRRSTTIGRGAFSGAAPSFFSSATVGTGAIPSYCRRKSTGCERSCHRLIWLNPLLGSPEYEPLTRGMVAALPHVDDFLPVHNLESLEALAKHLERLERP